MAQWLTALTHNGCWVLVVSSNPIKRLFSFPWESNLYSLLST